MAGTSTMMRRAGTGLAVGLAATAALGTAVVGTAAAASASTPGIVRIHKVACSAKTFTVHYDVNSRKVCLEGTGTIRVSIPDVSRVTTGENTGRFIVRRLNTERQVTFRPGQTIVLLGVPTTMVSVTISRA